MNNNKFCLFILMNMLMSLSVFADNSSSSNDSTTRFRSSKYFYAANLHTKLGYFFSKYIWKKPSSPKPNILFFILDELRFPPTYESEELKKWKQENLVFQNILESKGIVFHNHYTNSNACSPSRATLHTGQYPQVHGVTQTSGLAKPINDPKMTWLAPFTVPTIGNYLREAGYKTVLKGKWHVTDSSIRLGDGNYLTTYDTNGHVIPEFQRYYLEKNVLDAYGYDGWIGPEPHGKLSLNSGSSVAESEIARDVKYTEQLIEELDSLAQQNKPWLLVASYLNPHDIAIYGLIAQLSALKGSGWYFPVDPTLPEKLFTDEFELSYQESLATKPPAQASYRDLFATSIQPIVDVDLYQRYYYALQKKVDENMLQVWNKLLSSPQYENTIIVFTSDHGELLSSHGGMIQKWYQAYQEAIHIPLIISSPKFGNVHKDVYDLTSHIDILPTFLDFAQADPEALRLKLGEKFSLNLPLPGKSLYPLLTQDSSKKNQKITPVYFYTEDNPTRGTRQKNPMGKPYESVIQPASVEAILTYINDELWKITHYYSEQDTIWDEPSLNHEIYNITKDPLELVNLYNNSEYKYIQQELLDLLDYYASLYRYTD